MAADCSYNSSKVTEIIVTTHLKRHALSVILSGGSGTRLANVARVLAQAIPAACFRTYDVQETLLPAGLPDMAAPLVVCSNEHRFLAASSCVISVSTAVAYSNLWAAIPPLRFAIAAFAAQADNASHPAVPADHLIQNVPGFTLRFTRAQTGATDKLVTFGITPDEPATGLVTLSAAPHWKQPNTAIRWRVL